MDKDRYKLITLAQIPLSDDSWAQLHDLAQQFNVKVTVGDAQPERHKIREFAKSEAACGNTVYSCFYIPGMRTFDNWADDGSVKVNMTEIFDETHHMVKNSGRLEIPRVCEEVKVFAHQMCQRAKFLETNPKTGIKTYTYKKVGDKQEHYRNVLNYFRLGCKKVGLPIAIRNKIHKTTSQDMTYVFN